MSSILKDSRGRSKFWIASFTSADGRRLKRSTKTTDAELAKRIAAEWHAAGKAGRAGRLTESHFRKVASEIFEQATGRPIRYVTARSWLDGWIEDKRSEKISERTLSRYKQIVRDFLAHLGNKADEMLAQVTDADLKSFRNRLDRTGLAASTINLTIKILHSPFHLAHVKGHITVDPCAGVGLIEDDQDTQKDVFTREQIGALIEKAEGDWKGAILCGYCTGLRLKDVTELRWESIDA